MTTTDRRYKVFCPLLGSDVVVTRHATWRAIERWNLNMDMSGALMYLASQIAHANMQLKETADGTLLVADWGVIVINKSEQPLVAATVYGWNGKVHTRPVGPRKARPRKVVLKGKSGAWHELRRKDERTLMLYDSSNNLL